MTVHTRQSPSGQTFLDIGGDDAVWDFLTCEHATEQMRKAIGYVAIIARPSYFRVRRNWISMNCGAIAKAGAWSGKRITLEFFMNYSSKMRIHITVNGATVGKHRTVKEWEFDGTLDILRASEEVYVTWRDTLGLPAYGDGE